MEAPSTDALAVEWFRACSLRERADIGRHAPLRTTTPLDDNAAQRLELWRKQPPFTDPARFAQRLATDGLDEASFVRLLGASPDALCAATVEVPGWIHRLEEVEQPSAWQEHADDVLAVDAGIVTPFVRDGVVRLVRRLEQSEGWKPTRVATLLPSLLRPLVTRLGVVLNRVLMLELQVARLRGQLSGETPADRFRSFTDRFRNPTALGALLREYPVAGRGMVEVVDQWATATAELLERFSTDAELLDERFCAVAAHLGTLDDVQSAGDPHRGGRTVAILRFSSGARIVYKPRRMRVEVAFGGLLEWVNQQGWCPPLHVPGIVDRGSYGWMEFLEPHECTVRQEVSRYHERLGALLAILYVLQGDDMHLENIVAVGEHPAIIDVETLFHPAIDVWLPADEGSREEITACDPVEIMRYSVLKTGMLPKRIWQDEEGHSVDVSVIGAAGAQILPGAAAHVVGAGTDEMRITRGDATVGASRNQPRLSGAAIAPLDFADDLDRGFTGVYRGLAAHKAELTADGLLAAFAGAEVRVVARVSQVYGALLREATHPDFLRDALDQDRFFDKLWLEVPARERIAGLVPAEREALRRGDVPVFTTNADSCDLRCDTNGSLREFFRESGIARAQRRAGWLGEDDLARQRWLIRGALAALTELPPSHSATAAGYRQRAETRGCHESWVADDITQAAVLVGHELHALALRGSGLTSWLTMTTADGRRPVVDLARYDLYGGAPGIALFLEALGRHSGDARHDVLARSAYQMVRECLHDGDVRIRELGAFTGLGGVLHALGHLHRAWPDLPVAALAESVIARVVQLVDGYRSCAVFGGLAGAVAGLLSYDAMVESPRAVATATACGERLMALAHTADGGMRWTTPGGVELPVRNFAFGTAGIAWALRRLATVTGQAHFGEAAVTAQHADLLRSDLGATSAESSPHATMLGRHAGDGLILSLLEAGESEGAARVELVRLTEVLCQTAAEGDLTLDSGGLGIMDALLAAECVVPSAHVRACIVARRGVMLDEMRRSGWRSAAPLGLETPGLMNGLAGVGFGLLRLADPAGVPSVLTLGPAPSRQRLPGAGGVP